MVNLETYYSFANIRKVISIRTNRVLIVARFGQFSTYLQDELKAINAEIIRIRGNSDITIFPNVTTLVGAKCKVSLMYRIP